MATNILATIREFFGMDAATFRKEWSELSTEDKADIKRAFDTGAMTY